MVYFGLENPSGNLNCFLNAIIQSLWNLSHFRKFLIDYITGDCMEREDQNNPLKIFNVIEALRNLYVGAHNYDNKSMVLNPSLVRKELFKLYYTNGEFCLN